MIPADIDRSVDIRAQALEVATEVLASNQPRNRDLADTDQRLAVIDLAAFLLAESTP